jgi:DNA-binding CsgD family transcriptional regulator
MIDEQLSKLVEQIYEAAVDSEKWRDVRDALRIYFNAHSVALGISSTGHQRNLLSLPSEDWDSYRTHYHLIDPYRVRLLQGSGKAWGNHRSVVTGSELVSDEELLNSEYYNYYAKRLDRRHSLGGLIGAINEPEEINPLGIYRAACAGEFGQREKQALLGLLPHMTRALQLGARLSEHMNRASLGLLALEGVPLCIIVVDSTMRIHFANESAINFMQLNKAELRMKSFGPAGSVQKFSLIAAEPRDNSTLRSLVLSAAAGGAGGRMRLTRADDCGGLGTGARAALVARMPRRLMALDGFAEGSGLAIGMAIVVLRDLSEFVIRRQSVLGEIFGLTTAESAVAAALVGGATADQVAHNRHVTLDTIRSQIRSILYKTEADNLRSFVQIATLII